MAPCLHRYVFLLFWAVLPITASAQPRAPIVVERFLAAMTLKDRSAVEGLLHADATVEYPFDRSGRTDPGSWRRFEGRDAVMRGYVDAAFARIARIGWKDRRLTESKNGKVIFVEASGDMVLADGTPYRNLYVLRFDVDGGRIPHFREYLNPVTAALATGAPLGAAADGR